MPLQSLSITDLYFRPPFVLPRSLLRTAGPRVVLFGSIISVGVFPSTYMPILLSFWLLLACTLLLLSYNQSRRVLRKFDGRILKFVSEPTPAGSMLGALKESNISPQTISHARFMSADVPKTFGYFHEALSGLDGRSFLETVNQNADIEIYGRVTDEVRSNDSRVRIVPTKETYTKHTNLFLCDNGKSYVWYEPYHAVLNGKYYFLRGAYLLEISTKQKDKLLRYYEEVANDNHEPQPKRSSNLAETTSAHFMNERVYSSHSEDIERTPEWKDFQKLALKWRKECGATSSITQMALCDSYQRIIGMGEKAVVPILHQLQKEAGKPDHWFWALRALTGEDPVPEENWGNMPAMAQAWLAWGRKRGYVK